MDSLVRAVLRRDVQSELVAPFIRKRKQKRFGVTKGWFRCSSLGKCNRLLGLQYLGIEAAEPDPQSLEKMDYGTERHLILQDRLKHVAKEAGFSIASCEKSFRSEEYRLSGHVDGIITVNGEDHILEIKTTAPFHFERMFASSVTQTFESYRWQATGYCLLSGIERIIFIVEEAIPVDINGRKGFMPGRIMESRYLVPQADVKRLGSTLKAVRALAEQGKVCEKPKDAPCSYCGYKHVCQSLTDGECTVELT